MSILLRRDICIKIIYTHHAMRALLSRMSRRNAATATVHPVYDVEELVNDRHLLVAVLLSRSTCRWRDGHCRTAVPSVHHVQAVPVVHLRRARPRSAHPEPLGPHPETEFGIVRGPSQLAADRSYNLLVLGPAHYLGPAARPVVLLPDPLGVPSSVLLLVLFQVRRRRHRRDRLDSWMEKTKTNRYH